MRRVSPAPGVERLEAREVPAAVDTLPVLPGGDPAALDHARAVAAAGRALGRRADVFMYVGDSNSSTVPFYDSGFLHPLGLPGYDPYAAGLAAADPGLADTWAAYLAPAGPAGDNSFTRPSSAAYPGWTLDQVLPTLPGEVAATNAGVALVMIGTNDLYFIGNPDHFRTELSLLVQVLTAAGVVPVLSTIPDHADTPTYSARSRVYNQVIADVAEGYRVPVWNLRRALDGLPAGGLKGEGIHLNASPPGAGAFGPFDLLYGQNLRNFQALQVLDWFRTAVAAPAEAAELSAAWTPPAPGADVVAVGRDRGQGPVVSVFDAATGALLDRFQAFEPAFTGGVRVAVADTNLDGYPDVIAVPGPGGGPVVKVFSGRDGSLLATGYAFEPAFRDGYTVAAGDLDGDGRPEVVVGAGPGGGPRVVVLRGADLGPADTFFAFEESFRGGVNVGVANLPGYGRVVVAGAGAGGGPAVRLFRYGAATPAASVFVADVNARVGAFVAAGDLDGDGADELVAAPAAGTPVVWAVDPDTGGVWEGLSGGRGATVTGPRVAAVAARLLAGNGPGARSTVRGYARLGLAPHPAADDPLRALGLYVG